MNKSPIMGGGLQMQIDGSLETFLANRGHGYLHLERPIMGDLVYVV